MEKQTFKLGPNLVITSGTEMVRRRDGRIYPAWANSRNIVCTVPFDVATDAEGTAYINFGPGCGWSSPFAELELPVGIR